MGTPLDTPVVANDGVEHHASIDAVKPAMSPTDVEELIRVPFDGPITRSRAKKIAQGTRSILVRLAAIVEESNKKRWVTMI